MNVNQQIAANQQKTWVIMGVLVAVVVMLSWLFAAFSGYQSGGLLGYIGFSLILAGIINYSSYYWSDKMVLAMTGAKPVDKKQAPDLHKMVEKLSQEAKIPKPKVYIVNDPTPNAFATGRDPEHAVVAVHTGLLERLNGPEVEGVVAHEISHVRNFDTRIMAMVAMLAGTLAILADLFMRSQLLKDDEENQPNPLFMVLGIASAVLAPLAAQLIQFAVSRRREFLADASAALLTKSPEGLASALLKISLAKTPSPTAHTGTAHLYISNPFGAKAGSGFFKLFVTHPPVEERVKALRALKI